MNFNEIKNRLLIGALAITVFPFYVHAQNDKMEGQTAHRTKAWEIGVGGALINWDRVTFSDFRQVDGNYLYRMNIDHLFGGFILIYRGHWDWQENKLKQAGVSLISCIWPVRDFNSG